MPSTVLGSSTGEPAADERWTLRTITSPSFVPIAARVFAAATGSPSLDSPSVMLMTTGGKPSGCSEFHFERMSPAILKAEHIGVPPLQDGSNQTGNFTVS